MSEDQDKIEMTVRVNPRQVHIAVQNVIKNEMGLDHAAIENQIREHMESKLGEYTADAKRRVEGKLQEILDYKLSNWITDVVEKELERTVRAHVSNAANKEIGERLDDAVDLLFRDGFEAKVGWRKRTVRISAADKPESDRSGT